MAATGVLLDRDGVLIDDVDLLVDPEAMRVLAGVPEALRRLSAAAMRLVTVSNQTVVARGLATERDVEAINLRLDERLEAAGGPRLDGHYFCPHHPQATLEQYRMPCDCRKPGAGLLRLAAAENHLDLSSSYLVGDRPTDIAAGAAAGCSTILVRTGRHLDPLIETAESLPPDLRPDHVADDLSGAADWILSREAG